MQETADRSRGDAPVVAIVGPTATGKTDVAMCVALALGGEIVSADSVAVYRGMDIGAAKPDSAARARVPFHLLDVVGPAEEFSAARFRELGEEALAAIRARGTRPIVAGGTGLYVRVLLEGYGLTGVAADARVRAELEAEADREGTGALHTRLAGVDPAAAERIHPNDRRRVVRALEVLAVTGEPISAHQARDAAQRRPRASVRFALTADRDELDRRIEARVHGMVRAGLVDEVRSLLAQGFDRSLSSMRSLGYREIAAHLAGEMRLDQAVLEVIGNTRRFARRQLTWFRADHKVTWLDVGGRTPEHVAAQIVRRLEQGSAGPREVD